MKVTTRVLILLIFVLGIVAMPAAAQDDVAADNEDGLIAITMSDTSTFIVNENEDIEAAYLLTVNSPMDFAPAYVNSEDSFLTYNYPLLELQGDWDFAVDLTGEAILVLGAQRVQVTIGAPTIDLETGELTFPVLEAAGLEEGKDGLELPEIEDGSLMIRMDGEFFSNLMAGRDARLNSTRDDCENCTQSFG
jgi:hypothetical protein